MKKFYAVLFYFFVINIFAQKTAKSLSNEYENLKKELNISPESVIKKGKTLTKKAIQADDLKLAVKSYNTIGFAYYHTGNSDSCLYYSNTAIQLAKKIRYREGEALGLRLLGTEYARLGLRDKAEKTFVSALTLLEGQKNDETYTTRGMVYSSMLLLFDDEKEQQKKIDVGHKAINAYNSVANNVRKKELLPSAYTNLSYSYSRIGKYDSAHIYLQKALELIDTGSPMHLIYLYHQKGFLFSEEGKYEEAVLNYKKALSYCKGDEFYEKKMEILGRLSESYTALKDDKNALYYTQLYQDMYRERSKAGKAAVSKIENKISGENTDLTKRIWFLVGGCIILLLCIIGLVIKKKKARTKKETQQEININKDTEIQILNKLTGFEQQKDFIDPEISLYALSNKFQCNNKYLSATIKKYKNKSFTQYINDLRIEYIVEQLDSNPEFRKFKISHLAEKSGFSSHGSFSGAFISYTGKKPSEYLKTLRTE